MFEVLVYVYENYWHGSTCPELSRLGRKLASAGFEPDEIHEALVWLEGLNIAAESTRLARPKTPRSTKAAASTNSAHKLAQAHAGSAVLLPCAQSENSLRVYSVAEQLHLGAQCLGFICFLETAGVLPPSMREIVIDRAMAAPGEPVVLDALKIIVLMVYWSLGEEPGALVLDELCEDAEFRVAH